MLDTTNSSVAYYKDWTEVEKGIDGEKGFIKIHDITKFTIPSADIKSLEHGKYVFKADDC